MIKVNTEELINTAIPLMVFIFKGFPKTGTLWIPGEAELLSVTAIRISNANSSNFLNIQEQIVFHKMMNEELKYVLKWVLI